LATYTYQCGDKKCKAHKPFEVTQRMKDDKLTTCPKCDEETLSRLITGGGGFRIGGPGVHKPTAHWGD